LGNFENLKTGVLNGAKLNVIAKREGDLILTFEINTVLSNDQVICAQSRMYLTFVEKWTSYFMCTNGRVYTLTFVMNNTESESLLELKDIENIDWFVLDNVCQREMLNENSKSHIRFHDQHVPSITVLQLNALFVKVNYQTFLDVAETYIEVNAYGEISSTCINGEFELEKDFAWKSSKYYFSHAVNELRCSINKHIPCTYRENRVHQNMFINENWEEAFVTTLSGDVAFGNFDHLRTKLLQGHNVKVYFSGKYREPDIVFVDKKDVTALFSAYPITTFGTNQSSVYWYLVSSSGRYEQVVMDYLTGNVTNHSVDSIAVSWFTDKAIWTDVHHADNNSTQRLKASIMAGSSIRIKSKCLYSNGNYTMVYCLYAAVNLYCKNDKRVSARSNLIPYPTLNMSEVHLSHHERPVWMHLSTHSDKVMRIRKMMYRSPYFEDDIIINREDTSWYANQGLYG
jgi:hypothetical protein